MIFYAKQELSQVLKKTIHILWNYRTVYIVKDKERELVIWT